jgi:hypothetical protein
MAVGLSATLANAMLAVMDTLGYEYVQFHTEDPGPNGTANIAGLSTRQLVEWATPASGIIAITDPIPLTAVPATERWKYFTTWTALSGGTFGASGVCTASGVTAGDNVTIDPESVTFTFPIAS